MAISHDDPELVVFGVAVFVEVSTLVAVCCTDAGEGFSSAFLESFEPQEKNKDAVVISNVLLIPSPISTFRCRINITKL